MRDDKNIGFRWPEKRIPAMGVPHKKKLYMSNFFLNHAFKEICFIRKCVTKPPPLVNRLTKEKAYNTNADTVSF